MSAYLNTSENDMVAYLLGLCERHGVFSLEHGLPHEDADLFDGVGLDSMGLVYMQAVIEGEFSVELPTVMLVSELRSIRSIAKYLSKHVASKD